MMDIELEIHQGDITQLAVDAIVNAANGELRPGGGVCGAIHRASGPELAKACREIGGCPTGEARITPGFELPASYVIHTVGPIWQGGAEGEDAALANCYHSSLQLAAEKELDSIAFPAISTGVFGFPADRAAEIAVASVRAEMVQSEQPGRVIFCVFDAQTAELYQNLLA